MKIQIYCDYTKAHNVEFLTAFEEGLRAHGEDVAISDQKNVYIEADLHIFWSMHRKGIIAECERLGKPYICLERGYIDRMKYSSVNLDGLNGMSKLDLRAFHNNDHRRDAKGWNIIPRQNSGLGVQVVMGQTPNDASLCGNDIMKWVRAKIRELQDTGKHSKIIFRPHPLSGFKETYIYGAQCIYGKLDKTLQLAEAVHTYSSNAGVDAWLNGIPATGEGKCSMLKKWQTHDGHCNGLRQWLNDLSYRQYNREEFKKGLAWDYLKKTIYAHCAGKQSCSTG